MTMSNLFSCFSGAPFPVVSWERVHKKFLLMSKMLACRKMLLLYHIYLPESSVECRILGWKSPAFWKHCIVVFLASTVGCGEVQIHSVPLYVTWFFSFLKLVESSLCSQCDFVSQRHSLLWICFHSFWWAPETHAFCSIKFSWINLLLTLSLPFSPSSLSWIRYCDVASIWLVL